MVIQSERQRKALEYALEIIRKSPVFPYVKAVYLFGSCARKEERFDSDVDLLLVMREEFEEVAEADRKMRKAARQLSSQVSVHANREPKVDLKLVIGDEWEACKMFFFQNVRKDMVCVYEQEIQPQRSGIRCFL